MELDGGDILLRPFGAGDADALVRALHEDDDIARFIPLIPRPYGREEAESWIERCERVWRTGESCPFAIVDTGSGALLGSVESHAHNGTVGYWIAADARNRGIATRAVRIVCEWNERRPLWLTTHPDNVPSQRVAEKAGFRRIGMTPHLPVFRDGTAEAVLFQLD